MEIEDMRVDLRGGNKFEKPQTKKRNRKWNIIEAPSILHGTRHIAQFQVPERLRLAKVVKPTYRLHTGARVNAALLTYLLKFTIFKHFLTPKVSLFQTPPYTFFVF